MKNYILTIIMLLTSISAMGHSARRKLGKDFLSYQKQFERKFSNYELKHSGKSALRSAVRYSEGFTSETTRWKPENLQARFETIRDAKYLIWRQKPEVMRRASWLYPDDGCWTRAAIAIRTAFQQFYPLPGKVYAFGNLRVKTKNSPRGVVGWWYHVAPIVSVNEEKYVLDPAIEWSRPLTLKEWLGRMGKPEKIKVAICSSGTYSPGDGCKKETNGLEIGAERVQQSYLGLEWKRMVKLNRQSEL